MISLCVIGKNNEKTIGACISSVKPLVSEIIYVDTGSIDNTKKIAASFGAKIFDFTWNDNYSDAKNASYARATQPWILSLDTDEVIALKDLQKIKNLVLEGDHEGYFLIQRNYTNKVGSFSWTSCKDDIYQESKISHGFVPRMMVRLFRNDPHIRAEGVAHDSVIPAIARINGKIKNTEIVIHHFGSLNHDAAHVQRYIDIEKRNIKNDFYQEYQIASQYHTLEKLNEAVEHLAKSLQLNPNFALTYLELALIGMKRGKISESKPLIVESLRLEEREMAWSTLGIVEVFEKNFEKAIECFNKAISMNLKNADHYFNLSQVLKETGKMKESKEALDKAIYLNPAYAKK